MGSKEDSVNVTIGKDLINPILETKVNAAIVEAMGDPAIFVAKMVDVVFKQKVNSKGVRNLQSNYENRYDLLDVLCQKTISAAVESALRKFMDENVKLVEDNIVQQLRKSPRKLAKQLVAGMCETTASQIRLKIDIEMPERY